MELIDPPQAFLNTPIALSRRHAAHAMEMMQQARGRILQAGHALPEGMGVDPTAKLYAMQGDRGYDLVNGLAVIPIEGVLIQQLGFLRTLWGYVTGYDGIRQSLANALDDDQVRRIALRINSPGGQVNECFDLVDEIYAARQTKPIAAVLCENAFSAAYAIASAAEAVTVPRTGGTGSIGIILMHADISRMLDDAGVKITFITSEGADRKTDGHSEIPLSDDALAAIQADIDTMGDLFHATVARNRGLEANQVRDFKAACFLGAKGVEVGLADTVMAPAQALRALASA